MQNRIGFYICHCGVNIASKVRVEEVAQFVRGLENVAVSRDYKFMCSDPGQEMIQKDIKELGLNRDVHPAVADIKSNPVLHHKTSLKQTDGTEGFPRIDFHCRHSS